MKVTTFNLKYHQTEEERNKILLEALVRYKDWEDDKV